MAPFRFQSDTQCFGATIDVTNNVNTESSTKSYNTKPTSASTTNGAVKSSQVQTQFIMRNDRQSKKQSSLPYPKEVFESPPFTATILPLIGFYILIILGRIHDWVFPNESVTDREGYGPILDKFESFYIRHVYQRIKHFWNTPVMGNPGGHITLKDVTTPDDGRTLVYHGTETTCLNLGSYNYLGFSENQGLCANAAKSAIKQYGMAFCSTRREHGSTKIHVELEKLIAEFLNVEDAITFGMGFATNSLNLPALFNSDCLVLSDERNHASLIVGIKVSGATCKVFQHNNVEHLESLLIENINKGQRKKNESTEAYKPWKKIFIIVEGVYSMDGSICHLPEIIALKKKYKAYLYLDEAHSIGALGPRGRGVCDYFNCDSKDVDILMGTFTKSFGSAGGYIAGSKDLINYIRVQSHASTYASAMAPAVAAQIIMSMKIIMGKEGNGEGLLRLRRLRSNTRYFRRRLHQMGLIVYGHQDSPVVPIIVYHYSKIVATLKHLRKHKIATVGVGYPATPMFEGRIRICLSAAHTKQELDHALDVIENLAHKFGLCYSSLPKEIGPIEYEAIHT